MCALLLAAAATVAVAAVLNGDAGDNRLVGTEQADTIRGYEGNDQLYGKGGPDTLNAGPGNDYLSGRDGADTTSGNFGSDRIYGDVGADRINGDNGADYLYGQTGRDVLSGDSGDDRIFAAGDGERDRVSCGAGFDRVTVDPNDVVDGQIVDSVLDLGGQLVGVIGSCERVEVRLSQ